MSADVVFVENFSAVTRHEMLVRILNRIQKTTVNQLKLERVDLLRGQFGDWWYIYETLPVVFLGIRTPFRTRGNILFSMENGFSNVWFAEKGIHAEVHPSLTSVVTDELRKYADVTKATFVHLEEI